MRVCVVGHGMMGEWHSQTLREIGVELHTLVGGRPDAAASLAEAHGYRWASPDEAERQAAMRYWNVAIEIAVEHGCNTMNSEFGRGPAPGGSGSSSCCSGHTVETCEAAFWKSMDELVPIFERDDIDLHIEPHPEDFVETLHPAVDMIQITNSKNVKFLYCAPHTFYSGEDTAQMIRDAAPVLAHVQVADTFNHKASSGLRYVVNPPGSQARVHQHLNIGQGEVDWDAFFGTLHEVGFDGIVTSCVFAGEERAVETSRFMRQEIHRYVDKYWGAA